MPPVILLIPPSLAQRIIAIRPDIMCHALGNGNLVSPHGVEKLVLLSQSEAISVDPCSVDATERIMKGILAGHAALLYSHVWKDTEFLSANRLRVAS